MNILFVSLLALLVVEYFFRIPLVSRARALLIVSTKSVRVILSKNVSDHWKEVVLLHYAKEVAMHTAVVALMIIGSAALLVLPALVLDWLFMPSPTTIETFASVAGIACMTLVAFIYVIVRKCLGHH